MDRSAEVTLSEGQIPFRDIVPSSNFRTYNFALSPFSYIKFHFYFWKLSYCIIKQTNFPHGCRSFKTGLASTLIDGSSQGEILLPPQTSRSDSTASFQSATGSLGEIPAERFSPTDDDVESEWKMASILLPVQTHCLQQLSLTIPSIYTSHKLNKYTSVVFELIKHLNKMITVHRWNDNKECKSLHSHPTPR